MIRLDEDHPGATVHRNAFQMFDKAGSLHSATAQTSSAPSPPVSLPDTHKLSQLRFIHLLGCIISFDLGSAHGKDTLLLIRINKDEYDRTRHRTRP